MYAHWQTYTIFLYGSCNMWGAMVHGNVRCRHGLLGSEEQLLFNWVAHANTCMCTATANLQWFFSVRWTTSYIWLHWLPVSCCYDYRLCLQQSMVVLSLTMWSPGFWCNPNDSAHSCKPMWRMVCQIKSHLWKNLISSSEKVMTHLDRTRHQELIHGLVCSLLDGCSCQKIGLEEFPGKNIVFQ